MAEVVSSTVCQIVYGDTLGECHLQLPIFIDDAGACHVSLSPASDILDQEAGAVLSHICLGASPDDARKECLRNTIERALSAEPSLLKSGSRRSLEGALRRLGSLNGSGTADEKDALRRAVIIQRHEAHAQTNQGVTRTCVLSYTEQQQLLLSSH